MYLSLKYRIAIIIFFLEAIMMGVVLWQTLGHSRIGTETQLTESEDAILEIMSGISRVALLTEEYAELQLYLERTLRNPRIVQALVVDVNKRVVAGTKSESIGKPPPSYLMKAQGDTAERHFWRTKEINNAAGRLGTLALELSNTALVDAIAESRRLGISIAVVGMLLIAIVGVIVGILLTRRLKKVTDTARGFTQGNLSARTGIHGQDEIGELGQIFDNMAKVISDNQKLLQDQVAERTAELEVRNRELEAFSYSVSHDLRAPLRSIDGFSLALLEDNKDQLDDQGKNYLNRIRNAAQRMGILIDDMLELSRTTQMKIERKQVDLSKLAEASLSRLVEGDEAKHKVKLDIEGAQLVYADPSLMGIVIENLCDNAWKYTSKKTEINIKLGSYKQSGERVFFIKDNGAGFDMRYIDKLFGPFQRLHKNGDFKGTGIGLATVQRIIHRHGGRVWAEAEKDKGATFYFTVPEQISMEKQIQ